MDSWGRFGCRRRSSSPLATEAKRICAQPPEPMSASPASAACGDPQEEGRSGQCPWLLAQASAPRAAAMDDVGGRVSRVGDQGTIVAGGVADLLIVRDNGQSPCDSLITLSRCDIAAVMRGGEITVASEEFFTRRNLATEMLLFPFLRHGLQWHIAAPPDVLTLQLPRSHKKSFSRLTEELTKQ